MESKETDTRFERIVKALTEIAKGMKSVALYPENHPTLKNTLMRICDSVEEIPPPEKGVEIEVSKLNLSLDGKVLPEKHSAMGDLRNALFTRRTKKLIILPGITPEDLSHFLIAISEDPAGLLKKGGLENVLIARKISKIWVNKVDYDKLMEELKKEQEQAPDSEEPIILEEVPPHTEEQIEEELIEDIIAALSKSTSSGEYRDLVFRISRKINQLVGKQGLPYAEKAIKIYAQHVEYPPQGDEEIKNLAISGIKELSNEDVIDSFVKKFSSKSLQEMNEAQIVLLILGETAVLKILEALTTEKDLIVRKGIVDLVIKIGEPAIPFVVKYLSDKRWYVVRNMVTILGGVAIEEVAPHIGKTLKNPDPRVKKEAIRALSKVPGSISIATIGDYCFDSDANIAIIAVTSLGAKKEEEAVELLHKRFLAKKIIYPDYRIAKEVIESLKNIGTDSAVQILENIALYSPIIKTKRAKELKLKAVNALGKVKSEKSEEALNRLAKSSDTICKQEASKLLQRLGYGKDGA